ncbi:MAG TPA: FAD-dependent oxidoreductase, partial [Tianweitania sediminis]|nr:FAD-dependent oxidoreductase [Tianweitania sediminis]
MNSSISAVQARRPFDPAYDPLHAPHPGHGKEYAPTYWIATAGTPPEDDGPVSADMDVDVAVIGSGYTGLSCAIHLARDHGINATVLEANGVAWGCSTRNGGQAQLSSGRLKRSQWIERWGVDVAKKLHVEIVEAFDLFRDLIRAPEIDCDPQDGGHLYIAHRDKVMPLLAKEVDLLNRVFGYKAKLVSRAEVHADYVHDAEAQGAMFEPDGMSIHAAKLAFGYLKLARKLGAKVHTSSPVTQCIRDKQGFRLVTPGGIVRARAVCFATAGYTSPSLHPLTRHRLMPILSNSLVTRPLTASEREGLNFRTMIPLTDTRTLRHYYRLLPDNRVQIGSRSAITGRDAANRKHYDLLLAGLHRKFPGLRDIQVDYSWWGWVDVSH